MEIFSHFVLYISQSFGFGDQLLTTNSVFRISKERYTVIQQLEVPTGEKRRRHVAKGSRMAGAKKLPISSHYGYLYA